jgi:hypothetical protein
MHPGLHLIYESFPVRQLQMASIISAEEFQHVLGLSQIGTNGQNKS